MNEPTEERKLETRDRDFIEALIIVVMTLLGARALFITITIIAIVLTFALTFLGLWIFLPLPEIEGR